MKTIFIDRDGVINKDPGGWTKHSYVTELKDIRYIPGSFEALRLLSNNRTDVIIVSNQAGVSKGYFTRDRLDEINDKMLKDIGSNGGRVEAVYYCTHKDDDNCRCRKPNTGLLERAARDRRIDLRTTFIIGDGQVDVEAGRKFGIKTILVLSGKTSLEDVKKWKDKPDFIFKDLLEAVKWLLQKEKRRARRAEKRKEE